MQVCEVVRSLLASELSRLRGVAPDQLADELDDLRVAQKADQESAASGVSWSIGSVARAPTLRLPLLLVCALQAGQQCSGINAVSEILVLGPFFCETHLPL
jgi:hypothetical protein